MDTRIFTSDFYFSDNLRQILLAKEIAAESNSQEEILERIERDDYMKYAVEEVYYTLKLVLTETLEAEGRMWYWIFGPKMT